MILTGININTRYAFGVALKTKSATEVRDALVKIFDKIEKIDVF